MGTSGGIRTLAASIGWTSPPKNMTGVPPTKFRLLRSMVSPLVSRSEEHTSELQSHRDLHSFPTRRSSDLDASGFDRLDVPAEEHDRGAADKVQVAPVYGVAARVVYGPAGGGRPGVDVRLLRQGAAEPVVVVDHEPLADHAVPVESGDEH